MSSPGEYLLAPGHVLSGTYRIERPLGKGGMGEVYEASHARLAGKYAVKLLLREIGQNDDVLQRFKQEADVTSRLRHPNIVQVIDFAAMPDGTPFLVMELLEGRDLAHELEALGRLPLARVVDLVDQIATGLAAAHAENIVHRDLKPANIFLVPLPGRRREVAKIVDFGISKVRAFTAGLTRTQAVIGTPQYMAPEQARGQIRDIDARTDQFALGAIAFEMLAGRPAFEGEQVSAILYQIVHEEPPTLAALGVPGLEAVEGVIRRAMAKTAADRFPSASDFAQALEAAARGTSGGAALATGSPAVAATSLLPSGTGRAAVLPPPAPRTEAVKQTTLRESAGELATVGAPPARRRPFLVVALGAASALGAGGLWYARTRAPEVAPLPAAAPTPAPPPPASPPSPSTIVVEIAAAPPGLRVQLDGREVAVPLRMPRGERGHRLTFSAAGYATKEQWITAERDLVVAPDLEKAASPPKAAGQADGKPGRAKRPPKPHVVTDL